MLAACTSESENGPSANISYENIVAAQQVPVTFGTYVGEKASTRFGDYGDMDLDGIKNSGFGVFGYYTNASTYASAVSGGTAIPNFMYNQLVEFTDTDADSTPDSWTYYPLKYWPNEYGATATATETDLLSFFAYAPYVTAPGTGTPTAPNDNTVGIYSLSSNSTSGDPLVTYKFSSSPDKSVDLMYGVAAHLETTPSVVDTEKGLGQSGTIAEDASFIDLSKQKIKDPQIKFKFKHALARLGIDIVAAFDATTVAGSIDANTTITVKSVKLTGTWKNQDVLNLHTGAWEGNATLATSNNLTIDASNQLNPAIKDPASVSAWSDIATAKSASAPNTLVGVNETLKPVIALTGASYNVEQYLTFIPSGTPSITGVEIIYYVNTNDTQLQNNISRVENHITKTCSLSLTAGNAYKLKLILGMTSVTLDAEVAAWGTGGTTEVWLPLNVNP